MPYMLGVKPDYDTLWLRGVGSRRAQIVLHNKWTAPNSSEERRVVFVLKQRRKKVRSIFPITKEDAQMEIESQKNIQNECTKAWNIYFQIQ